MTDKTRVHLFITGRVQGVLFRDYTKNAAKEFGVFGFVKNLLDGRVEIVCEGEKESVEKFLEWCKQGSPLSKVENAEVSFEDYKGEFKDFDVREFGF
ncbi:MAG: acylphosphatase [Candidatus Wildermuthbacteria bacterium RIFCSPHIGHO2_01_FULL_48_25]|uniref:Acylphosphatase n=1 Tax=Candidatus Wildermuthbacteria bacterium RIFCSPLOWO2_01_FULL_48_16 TaxID=1802461 RepID=A0A1G2RJN8_9BACT|nr:MAG: acylphosphatase [Candidatus Wildermuthbacteria bacterium RIFCSPHIGHO2_01_FULL_48_25]OHA68434.1 MAG: acylphosphatase [Candidatus Wildermuthbacteria bacterium RIFCSPHIGHO2_02_FULL_49_12b]OHA73054.1 MAG: acylphosphatase [Candidatus Wildermuthbacteria bacterium RIFCSPLOWO2_01_FULL_48_16]